MSGELILDLITARTSSGISIRDDADTEAVLIQDGATIKLTQLTASKALALNATNQVTTTFDKYTVTNTTRDLTAASGNVSYTGAGFLPSAIIVFVDVSAVDKRMSWGFSDGTSHRGVFLYSDGTTGGSATVIYIRDNSSNIQSAVVSSFDSDGVTLTWTKTNSPTGTANISIMYLF